MIRCCARRKVWKEDTEVLAAGKAYIASNVLVSAKAVDGSSSTSVRYVAVSSAGEGAGGKQVERWIRRDWAHRAWCSRRALVVLRS